MHGIRRENLTNTHREVPIMWGSKETPEEYRERKEREQEEYEERQARREERQQAYEERQARREESARIKANLIYQASAYSNSTDWKKGGEVMRDLMSEWKSAGYAGDDDQSLWSEFQSARQTFFDNREAFFEKRNAERARNLSAKESVASRMNSLSYGIDGRQAKQIRAEVKRLMSEWKSIGPIAKDDNERLWSTMQTAMDSIHSTLQAYFDELNRQRESNKSSKEILIGEAQMLAFTDDWQSGKSKVADLRSRWKSIGSAGQDNEDGLYRQFNSAIDNFYTRMNRFYEERNRKFMNAANHKKELVRKAESIAHNSSDYTDNSLKDEMSALMDEWKGVGHAGQDDQSLWNQFNSARSTFYDRRKHAYAEKVDSNSKSYKDFGDKQYQKSLRSHEKRANEHLRKSENYPEDYDKDYALKTVNETIRHSKDIHRRTDGEKNQDSSSSPVLKK